MPSATRTAVFAITLLLSACALPPLQPLHRRTPESAFEPARSTRKEVVEKRAGNRLVAHDGTICYVTEAVFLTTHLGDRVRCLWQRDTPGRLAEEEEEE